MRTLHRRDLLKLTGAAFAAGYGVHAARQRAALAQTITPKAKRVVVLFQGGGVSQLETFDPKPNLAALRGTDLPESVRNGVRLSTMTGNGPLRVANALTTFAQYGQSGMWASDLVPHLASIADDLCVIRSTTSDAVNHDPATNLALTGSQLAGKPSMGAWISYALGVANASLPSFVSMMSQSSVQFVQPLPKRLYASAFLPATHQGIAFRGGDEPVLYLNDGSRQTVEDRHSLFAAMTGLNDAYGGRSGNPNAASRNLTVDIAEAMETSVAEFADLSDEPESTFTMYGPKSRTVGSYAANCIRARRLLERDVRCVTLLHKGWDHHYHVPQYMKVATDDTDQPTAALITDLKQRGLLEDTLVVWLSEFGRTAHSQGEITAEDHGRDHHPYAFTTLLAGAGVRPGLTYGETDDFSFNVVKNPVHIHDLHATILHLLGVNHVELTALHDGRNERLTDLAGRVITDILS
jgi:uncharacterized protein (DUF1501 family)